MARHRYGGIIVMPPTGHWASASTDDLWTSGERCERQSTTESDGKDMERLDNDDGQQKSYIHLANVKLERDVCWKNRSVHAVAPLRVFPCKTAQYGVQTHQACIQCALQMSLGEYLN